jgi:ubiquinone/menaquinone biosynthesis C-methylase UbiE
MSCPPVATLRRYLTPDDAFDAVYLVSTLGQVPDMKAVLRELSRVVHPGGRVVVGELCYDPHGVFFGTLRRCATAADLRFERRVGGWEGYFARFTSVEVAGPSRPGRIHPSAPTLAAA